MKKELQNSDNNHLDSIIHIPCDLQTFFYYWIQFLAPLKKMTDKEKLVLSHLLYKRHLLSKTIQNTEFLDKNVLSVKIKKEIAEAMQTSIENVQVYVSNLKRKGVIIETGIHPKFIPKIKGNSLLLGIYFNVKNGTEG